MSPVLFISATRIIGSYNKVVRDITIRNVIVMKVMKSPKLANIDNTRVAQAPGLRWNVVLKDWYQQITDVFINNNSDWATQNESLIHQDVGLRIKVKSFCSKIEGLEARVYIQSEDKDAIELASDNYQVQKEKIGKFLKENSWIKRQVK